MEKFKEYSNILSVKRKRGEYSNIEKEKIKNKIIQSVGSYENYKIYENAGYDYIDLYETELHKQIKDKASEYNINWNNQVLQIIVSWIMQPLFTKLGVEKNSLIWYMLSWGLIEVIFETWDELTKTDDKPASWCNIFSKGASAGLIAFLGTKGANKLLHTLGFGKNKAESSIVKQSLITGAINWVQAGTLDPFIENHICKEGGLWDEFIEIAGDIFQGGVNAIGSGLSDIGGFFIDSFKKIF